MPRVPVSFYLNVLAGVIVLFNHYVTSETGDVALNKVTGAAGRFYALFQDTAHTFFEHDYTSQLQTTICRLAMESVLPYDAIEYLRVHYCPPTQDFREMSSGPQAHRGYGGSDVAFAHFQPPMQPLVPRTSTQNLRLPSFGLNRSGQRPLSGAVWNQFGTAMATIGTLLLRSCASWWWFNAPFKMSSLLFGIYTALSVLSYLLGESVVVRWAFQVYMVAMGDFLRCIEWEAQHQALDIAISMMEWGYDFVTCARRLA